MKELSEGETLDRAAIKSGMSENTARRYRDGAATKNARPSRTYRTRVDPFEAVRPEVEKMLEAAPGLEARTIFERLQERPDSTFADGQLRTVRPGPRAEVGATRRLPPRESANATSGELQPPWRCHARDADILLHQGRCKRRLQENANKGTSN